MSELVWHDLECGGYRADLPLWLELAARHGDPILDVGAGSGRVALELASAGHRVVALDRDPELLGALSDRARRRGLTDRQISTLVADARTFEAGTASPFTLCVVPMQTIQLLGGNPERRRFLERAHAHLKPGGVLAAALTDRLELFEVRDGEAGPLPDMGEIDGTVFCSRPTAVRRNGAGYVLERRRERVAPSGERTETIDRITLDALGARQLQAEGQQVGFRSLGVRTVAPTSDHVGSEVVLLGA